MLDKYCVVTKKGYSVSDIDLELISDGGSETIPKRKVDIAEAHPNSQRTTVFYLTPEEANQIKNDTRVLSVELHPNSNPNVSLKTTAVDVRNYRRTSTESNWGLKRHTTDTMNFYNSDGSINTNETSNSYTYNNAGEGVDIMIVDTGVQADHPDFLDKNGVSRVQQIDWKPHIENAGYEVPDWKYKYIEPKTYYKEEGNHGTDVASIASGNLFGWAKKAHIYSCKWRIYQPFGQSYQETILYQAYEWIDIITQWHKNKKNNRPTIINLSVSYVQNGFSRSDVISGSYADANTERYTWDRENLTDNEISETYKIRSFTGDGMPAYYSYIAAFVEEAIDAGIHVVASAGNSRTRSVRLDNPEVNNTVTVQEVNAVRTIAYNEPSSLYAEDESLLVGATDVSLYAHSGDQYKEQAATFSTIGEAVNIFAAGDSCISATSKDALFPRTRTNYPNTTENFTNSFAGTSCSGPQVAGVLALYASEYPNYSPTRLRQMLLDDASTDQINSITTSYNAQRNLLDSPNKLLYSRYNNDIGFTLNNVSTTNVNLGQQYKFKTNFKRDSNIFVNYYGINAMNTDSNDGEFYNNNFSAIYSNTKIVSMYAENLGLDRAENKLKFVIILKFDGASVYNGGWTTMEISNKQANTYVKLKRKDADFDLVKQEFKWIHYDNNSLLRMSSEMQNRIGFW